MKYAQKFKPVGWRGESYRHYLAAKGFETKQKKYYERVPMFRKGTEMDPETGRTESFEDEEGQQVFEARVSPDELSRKAREDREEIVEILNDKGLRAMREEYAQFGKVGLGVRMRNKKLAKRLSKLGNAGWTAAYQIAASDPDRYDLVGLNLLYSIYGRRWE